MKMTKKQVQKTLRDLKNGLSMALAFILLTHSAQPTPVLAQVQDVAGNAAEAAESAEPEQSLPEPTVQEVLLEVCEAHEKIADVETCAKHLLGMVMTESEAKATAQGDWSPRLRKYQSHGWFQIHNGYNNDVTLECAQDLECSATWTLERMIKQGYLKYPRWAIWCHNGCGIAAHYVPKVMRKASFHWDKPIEHVTAEELRAQTAIAKK